MECVAEFDDWRPPYARLLRGGGAAQSADEVAPDIGDLISVTEDGQILYELAPDDTVPPRPFDLNFRTLVFTPNGAGGYSRSVRFLAWEPQIGDAVEDGAEVAFETFQFPFADRSWNAIYVSRSGVLTFGTPLTYEDTPPKNTPLREHAHDIADFPTVSPLFKPLLGVDVQSGAEIHEPEQHVAQFPDRVVVTWITTEPEAYPHGVPPEKPSRFQAVLYADGSVRFNYADVIFGDGVVGLFPNYDVTKGDVIASIVDETDPDVPGHVDLLDVTIYEAVNADGVIVEWTTRESIPVPQEGTSYSYWLYFDIDQPYWTRYDRSDRDFYWGVDVVESGERRARGGRPFPSDSAHRVALLADIRDLSGITASVTARAWVSGDGGDDRLEQPVRLELPEASPVTDLSRSDTSPSNRQSEVFHHRSVPDTSTVACRVIAHFGDEFDFFVFHTQFRMDVQRYGSSWRGYYANTNVTGTGYQGDRPAPCGDGRLKGHIVRPWWMGDRRVFEASPGHRHPDNAGFDLGLSSFAHEITHTWTASAYYLRNGEHEPMFGDSCGCHWRRDSYLPAAFPWRLDQGRHRSLMGGSHWRDNGDGTFTRTSVSRSANGHSWLDLYAMGLAEARDAPDWFILRNQKHLGNGRYRAEKEVVSIEQVIAAEGERVPSAADAQKDFNIGFIYLVEPGQEPSPEMLDLHRRFRDAAQEHWFHVTGGRSRITTDIPAVIELRR